MAMMDPALKRQFMEHLDEIKEHYRDGEGRLDEPAAVNAALVKWGQADPTARAWWDSLSPQSYGEVVCGEYVRRRRKKARSDAEATRDQPATKGGPSPEELNAEYSFPVGAGFERKRMGDASPEEMDALAAYHASLKDSHGDWEAYITAWSRKARQRQQALGFEDTATLFQIFGA